jgi:hypothetical protein
MVNGFIFIASDMRVFIFPYIHIAQWNKSASVADYYLKTLKDNFHIILFASYVVFTLVIYEKLKLIFSSTVKKKYAH